MRRERTLKKTYAQFYFKKFQKLKYFFWKLIIFNHFLKKEYKRPTIFTTINRFSITQSLQDRKITDFTWTKQRISKLVDEW
jgi:hypothetical protein